MALKMSILLVIHRLLSGRLLTVVTLTLLWNLLNKLLTVKPISVAVYNALFPRNGDLAYRTYLQVTLPEINQKDAPAGGKCFARWLDCPGEQLISMVEVEIGGQRIDRQYGDFMHIWNQLTLTSEQESGYNKMIGNTTQLTYLTDPLFADVATACGAASVPEAVCAQEMLFLKLLFTFLYNSGSAVTLDLHCH